jgi:hypothetical protein
MAPEAAPAIGVRLYADGRLVWARAAAEVVPAGAWALVETAAGLDAGLVVAPAVTLPEGATPHARALRRLTADEQARLRGLEAAGAAIAEQARQRAAALGVALRIAQARYAYVGDQLILIYAGEPAAAGLERLASDLAARLGCRVTPRAAEAATAFVGGTGRISPVACCMTALPTGGAACERLTPPLTPAALPYLNAPVDTPLGSGRVIGVDPGAGAARVALTAGAEPVVVPLADLRPGAADA